MVNKRAIQARLGVRVDGDFGAVSYTALLSAVAQRPVPQVYGMAMANNAASYGLEDTPRRLACFLGQCAHESGGYQYTREIWGPTAAQLKYDFRADLGNKPGDGYPMRGAGWIQVTGRAWFDKIGHALGLDLVGSPVRAGAPGVAVLISLEWWDLNHMNTLCETADDVAVTKRINGGINGLADRIAYTTRAMGMVA